VSRYIHEIAKFMAIRITTVKLWPTAELSCPTVLADVAASYVDSVERWKQDAVEKSPLISLVGCP
jgi:hypothetical protein